MAEQTAIAWCDSTFNPWIGCTKVGPGCDHCYAETLDKRIRYGKAVHWGAGVPRYRTSAKTWEGPLKWNFEQGRYLLAAEENRRPPPEPWRVFCASLADVFDNEVPVEWRADLMKLILETPNLSWLLVTKRIGNVLKQVQEVQDYHFDHGDRNIAGRLQDWMKHGIAPDNVRLLITVCNQEEADRDIPKLLALPCKNGVSYEPALGPIDFRNLPLSQLREAWGTPHDRFDALHPYGIRRVEWVIVGGESTQGAGKARPFVLGWGKDTIRQCRAAGVPVFFKQAGSNATNREGVAHPFKHRAGANPAEWPKDLRIQEFPHETIPAAYAAA